MKCFHFLFPLIFDNQWYRVAITTAILFVDLNHSAPCEKASRLQT